MRNETCEINGKGYLQLCFSALTRVTDPEKRQAVWRQLSTVTDARSEEQFDELFEKALELWSADEDTKSFGDYIRQEYGNKKTAIAQCYRMKYRINVNMFLESFHKQLKYRYDEYDCWLVALQVL